MGDSEASGLSAAACPRRITSVRAAAYRLPSAHQNALLTGSVAPGVALPAATDASCPVSCKGHGLPFGLHSCFVIWPLQKESQRDVVLIPEGE